MGDSKVTRLIGTVWGTPYVHQCGIDSLPMTLDWLAAGVPADVLTRAGNRTGYIQGYAKEMPGVSDLERLYALIRVAHRLAEKLGELNTADTLEEAIWCLDNGA
jgi:hypothetical protein